MNFDCKTCVHTKVKPERLPCLACTSESPKYKLKNKLMTLKKGETYLFSTDGTSWQKRIFHHKTKQKGYTRPSKFAVVLKMDEEKIKEGILKIEDIKGNASSYTYFTHFKLLNQEQPLFEKKEGEKLLQPKSKIDNAFEKSYKEIMKPEKQIMSFANYEENEVNHIEADNAIDIQRINEKVDDISVIVSKLNQETEIYRHNQALITSKMIILESSYKPKPKRKPIKIDSYGWFISGMVIGFFTFLFISEMLR